MANLYVWLKFFHLLGLAAFLLGHGVSAASALVLRGRAVDAFTGTMLKASIRSSVVTYPGLILLIVTGVWMGFSGSWWHAGWLWTAIVVLLATLVVMGALSVPYHGSRDALAKSGAPGELEAQLKRARPIALTVVGSVGLVVVLFLMVVKPF